MKNQVAYVRKHFIEFVVQCVPMITDLLSEEQAIHPIKKLVMCLINILRKVDLSVYGEDAEGIYFKKSPNTPSEHKIRATLLIKKQDHRAFHGSGQDNLVINSEMDILTIIDGIKQIIYHCLNIHPDAGQLTFTEDYEYIEGSGFSFKTIFGGGESHDKLIDKQQRLSLLKEQVLSCLKAFFVSCIYCWTDLSIFLPRDYLFSRTGVIGFRSEDQQSTNTMIENFFEKNEKDEETDALNLQEESKSTGKGRKRKNRKKKKKELEQKPLDMVEVVGSLKSYIQGKANQTHQLLIDVLKPIAYSYPNQFMQELMTIWLKKEDIQSINVNLSLVKLIQLLTCLELPLYAIIGSLNYNIEKLGFESKKVAHKKKVVLEMQE